MRLRIPGLLAWAAAGLLVVVGAVIVGVHTPPAARWSREWVVRQVAQRWQLDLATTGLSYNLFTGRVSLDEVRLSAPGHADAPFFSAKRLTAELPWVIVRGMLRISDLEVDDGRVLLVRENGTIVNLPRSSGAPPPLVPRRLDLRGLQVRGLDVDYEDRTGDVNVQVRGLRAALAGTRLPTFAGPSGPLTAASIMARIGARATTSGAVAGRMSFDGSNVALEGLTVPFPEARVVADGDVNRVLDDLRFALTLTGTLDLAAIAEWTPPPVPVSGPGTFEGTFAGPLGGYTLTAKFASGTATIARVPGVALDGVLTLTSPRAVIEPLTITTPPQGGTSRRGVFTGNFVYRFGDPGGSDLTGTYRDFDLDMALALYDQDPVAAAAWEQGTVRLGRDTRAAPLRMHATGRSTPLVRADRVALDGTWEATLERERWFVRHDHQVLDAARVAGTAQWQAGGDVAQTAITGPLTLDVSNVGAAVAGARRSGIGVAAALVDLKGTAHGDLVLGGTLARTLVTGRVDSRDLVLPNGAAATAGADIVYDEDSFGATAFSLETPGARVTGRATMGMASSRLGGDFAVAIDSLASLAAPWLGEAGAGSAADLAGTMQITGTIGGTTTVPDVPLRVESSPVTYGAQAIGTVTGDARLVGTDLRVERLVIDQGPGQLQASGRVDYETYAYDATIEGHGLTWAPPVPSPNVDSVTVDVSFTGAGTFAAPGGSGTLAIAPVGGLSDLVGATDVRWQFVNGTAAVTAFAPKLRLWAQADVEARAPYAFRGTALASRLDVQPIALAAGALTDAVTGTVGFSTSFQGAISDLANATAFVNLQDLDVAVGGLPVQLERPARVTLGADDVSVDDLALKAGSSTLGLTGRFRDDLQQPLRASFAGDVSDVVALARAFGAVPAGTTATGAVTATWESRGSLANSTSTVNVTNGAIAMDGVPPIDALTTVATFDGSTLSVDSLSAQWQGGAIAGTARIPRELLEPGTTGAVARPGRVDLKVTGLTEKALATWLPAATLASLTGRVSATLGADLTSATLTGVRGTIVLDEASVTASGVPISQSRPGYMSIADGVLRFDDVEFSAGVPVNIGGTVSFVKGVDLGVWITGTPGLRPFSVLSPSLAVDGAATLDLWITGPPAAPRVTGRIDLDDAELVMRDPRVIASDVTGPLIFEGDRISIPGLTGFLNGGALDASGAVTMTGLTPTGGDVTFQARGVAIEYPRNVDSEIDALLVFSPGPNAPVLRGDVRVLRSSYRATISVPALLAFNATSVTAVAAPSYLDTVRLDVSLSTEDDMIVDNNYGRFEAGANVRLQGTIGKPGVTGRAELREGGEIFLLNGVYRLNASGINFTNPAAIEPDMNISMVTQQNGGDVTVTLSGTLNRLQTNVTSTDPDANTDLLNVLIGGNKTLDGAGAAQLFSGELLGVTGRALGLDALRIQRGFDSDFVRDPSLINDTGTNPDARLTLSKRLRSDVEVILSRRLTGNGDVSAVVSYRPWRGVELRGSSLDNNDRAFGIRHELTFGGGSAPAATRKQTRVEVADVTIDGASPEDERALRGELKQRRGKAFNFITWREDTERLQAWYHERGYLEARVRASRTAAADDGRIGLTYRITRGPHTELRVTGATVSKRLRRELEEAWSDGVFDGFRTDEMRGAVAYDLVRRDIIGGRVEAVATTPAEGEKLIEVVVLGGEKVTSRTIAFTGVESLSTGDLETTLKARGLDDYVWLDPSSAIEPIQSRYLESGFRATTVTPSLPQVEAGKAVLPMAIVEGSLTTMRAVTVSGVTDEFAGEVQGIAHPLEGRAYRQALVDDALGRIEAIYRSKGYNSVAVTPKVALSDAPFADVQIAVVPGRPQVLQEVVVDSQGRTKPSAVTNALRLEPGTPVDLVKWGEARKRVYDTNVFRQVDVMPEVVPGGQPEDPEAVRARVTLTEWPAWRLRYGLQLNDAAEAQLDANGDTSTTRARTLGVVADLQNRNVFGRAFTFGLYGRAERRLQSSSAYLTFPTLFGRAVQTNVFLSRLGQDQFLTDDPEPTLRRTRDVGSLEQRIRRGRSLEVAYGYRMSHEVQRPFDTTNPFLLDVKIGHFTSSVFVDRRDDPFNAKRGWFASVSAERLSLIGSNSDSVKLLGTLYHYQPIGRFTAASAVRVGMSFVDPLLFSERFFGGGADTVRGYAQNGLGPRELGAASGGNALLVLNQELRAPLYKWVKGVVFVDAGNVYTAKRPTFSDLQVGYGVGIRLDTPFSILRVDFGLPSGGGARRFYLGIGQVF